MIERAKRGVGRALAHFPLGGRRRAIEARGHRAVKALACALWTAFCCTPAEAQPPSTPPASTETATSHLVEVNGVRLRYLKMGSGERAVVLLHGWPQHSLMWKRIMPPLAAAGYTVVAPDQRGNGGSSIPASGYDKATMAEDLHGLVRHLGLTRLDLVGYDHGAGVAYAYAAAHPDVVRRLVLIEYLIAGTPARTQALSPDPDPAKWNSGSNWHSSLFTLPDVSEWLLKGRERELLTWFFWHISCNPGAVDPADFEEYARQMAKPGALRAGIQYYATIWDDIEHNKRGRERKLALPVLAVGGACSAKDQVAASARLFAEDVQGAVLEGAGHWPTDENPEGLARVLLDFFGRTGR